MTVAALSIRPAAAVDIEPVVALACQAAPERGADEWRTALDEDLRNPQRLLLVAEVADEIVGYGRVRLFALEQGAPADTAPEGYYLMGLFVDLGRRRAGVGAALIEARLHWIADCADDAWFFANARNSGSIELHRRFGFEEVTRSFSFPGLTFDGGEGILFRSRLRSPRR